MAQRKFKNGDEFMVGEERYRVLDDKLYLMVATEIPPKVDSHRCCDHVCWHYTYPFVSGNVWDGNTITTSYPNTGTLLLNAGSN